MKLQVNNSCAWKQVLVFSVADLERAKAASHELAQCAHAAEQDIRWRILDGSERVVLHWQGRRGWFVPSSAVGYAWQP